MQAEDNVLPVTGVLPGIAVRPATVGDVEAMVRLINGYAARGEMLPKSLNQVYQNIRDFCVAERNGEIAGCGALHVLWNNLGEVRSLAVAEGLRRQGIGGLILQALLRDAGQMGLPQVFALTYKPRFFARWGFRTVERESLPRKIWVDCIDCIKFPQCDEVAVLRDLEVGRK
ncbi:MAG TPA: N-acetyltransferase [Anaerolineae bacterium]|nr:N-acetyltransferase [Anaerolineae bacterium]HOQ97565.1 N-acetyltransferase [Anaerolineae bacterium]HPL28794.1 N-acetyltransferase [Anaerolineae bacterium]